VVLKSLVCCSLKPGLIKSASSFAFNRHIKIGDQAAVSSDFDKIKVARADFIHALDEVHPAFGVSEAELQQCVVNGIIKCHPQVEVVLFSDHSKF
jgi:vesicle-fusing ATPase